MEKINSTLLEQSRPPGNLDLTAVGSRAANRARWNPYWVGVGLGIMSWAVFAIVNQPLGISTALSAASGACAAAFAGWEKIAANAYWSKHLFKWDYGMLFLIGTMLGAALSAWFGGTWHIEKVPAVWAQQFGRRTLWRYAAALGGGALVMYGARMAGGCTSGHGISGSLQLAVSSWTFFITMFVAGVFAAQIIFRNPRTNDGDRI